MSIGERLRRARLEQGLTLADVSEQTKVQFWILDALERDDVARVPGGVFIRGYLMSFARAVGLDGERIWGEFRAESTSPTVEPVAVQPRPVPAVGPWTIVRVAAIVFVVGVVWRNIPRDNPDTALPTPEPAQQRTTDVVLVTAATTLPAPESIAAPEPIAAPAPARRVPVATEPLVPAVSKAVEQKPLEEDAQTAQVPATEDVGANASEGSTTGDAIDETAPAP
jgi:cytoskeletal protein RodZ